MSVAVGVDQALAQRFLAGDGAKVAQVRGSDGRVLPGVSALLETCGYWVSDQVRADLVVLLHAPPRQNALADVFALCGEPGPPVVLIDLAGDPVDRILALEAGCDEVIAWPCPHREFIARIRGVARRRARVPAPAASRPAHYAYEMGQLKLCAPSGRWTRLSKNEHRLFCALVEAAGEPLDDKTLAGRIAPEADLAARSAHVAAWRLRKKLAQVFGEDVIEPVRARGYVLSRKVEMIEAIRAQPD